MTTLCDKYKAKCFADIKGQDFAIELLKFFIKKFPKKKSLILHGPAGTGKTSLAHALASETNSEIIELNASDLRNREKIASIIGQASLQKSLFSKNKILLVDEIDGITKDDKGGLLELSALITRTNFPIIMTANKIWDIKFSDLRRKSELIQLKELNYETIFKLLKEISEKENFKFSDDIIKTIAIKARGDIRAAINDLQTITSTTEHQGIHERDKEEDIFNILKQVLQQLPNHQTLNLYEKTSLSLDEIFLWLEENIPQEYKNEELYKAFNALSLADVFRGRIHRQQHWRFLVYQNFLLSAGVSSAKNQVKFGFTIYKKPGRILKIWLINQKQKYKKSVAEKYANYCHISRKKALKDFLIIKKILKNEKIGKELRLEQEEIDFLKA